MIELIFELLNNFIDWYQQFIGVPEGISYALFGAKKKKKRAQKKVDTALKTIDELDLDNIGEGELGDPEQLGEAVISDPAGADPKSINDIPFKPDFPYVGRQIIIDSGRVHLNAKDDFLVLMSKKSISLSSQGSVNVDANASFIVNANRIRLGIEATEPLVLGNKLSILLLRLGRTLVQCKTVINKPEDGQGTVIPEVKELVQILAKTAELLVKESLTITSTKNYTE